MAVKLTGQNIKDTYQQLIHSPEGGLVYDGTGSLLPLKFEGNDIIISGALKAHSYIVSESITNITSGSTAFGDSLDDTHTFKGAITASAIHITSTGSLSAPHEFGIRIPERSALDFGRADFVNINGATTHIMRLRTGIVDSVLQGADIWGNLRIKDFGAAYDTGHLELEGNITASGDISASGTIHTSTLIGNGTITKFEVSGSITAYTGSFDIIEGGTF